MRLVLWAYAAGALLIAALTLYNRQVAVEPHPARWRDCYQVEAYHPVPPVYCWSTEPTATPPPYARDWGRH
jgi:hypothetical protein